eukprot:4733505-Pleurochrysis_carterae.AAC.1
MASPSRRVVCAAVCVALRDAARLARIALASRLVGSIASAVSVAAAASARRPSAESACGEMQM